MAIESQNQLWINDLVIFIVVSNTVVVLFVFPLIDFAGKSDHSEIFLIALNQDFAAFTVDSFLVLLILISRSSVPVSVFVGVLILRPSSILVLTIAIHLLEVKILNK